MILVADKSSSVQTNKMFITEALLAFVDRFQLSENGIKIGIVGFSTEAKLYNELSDNKEEILNNIPIMQIDDNLGTSTSIDLGLYVAANELKNHGREGTFKVIVIITDGNPDSEYSALNSAQYIKDINNYNICGIFVKNNSDDSFLKKISSDNCYVETYFENLIQELNKLDVCF